MAKMKNALKMAPESKKVGSKKGMGMKTPKPMVSKSKSTSDKVKGGAKPAMLKKFA